MTRTCDNRTTDAVELVHRRYVKGDPGREVSLCEERANADVARLIHDVRVNAGLTQKQLAGLVGTSQSAIARIEGADYEGHSLAMLHRVAGMLGRKVTVGMPKL